MASNIKETPVLKGKEAISFLNTFASKVTHVPSAKEKENLAAELKQMKDSYKALHFDGIL
jgi:hypothetical protein